MGARDLCIRTESTIDTGNPRGMATKGSPSFPFPRLRRIPRRPQLRCWWYYKGRDRCILVCVNLVCVYVCVEGKGWGGERGVKASHDFHGVSTTDAVRAEPADSLVPAFPSGQITRQTEASAANGSAAQAAWESRQTPLALIRSQLHTWRKRERETHTHRDEEYTHHHSSLRVLSPFLFAVGGWEGFVYTP